MKIHFRKNYLKRSVSEPISLLGSGLIKYLLFILLFVISNKSFAVIPYNTSTYVTTSYNECSGVVTISFLYQDIDGDNDEVSWADFRYWNGSSFVNFAIYRTGYMIPTNLNWSDDGYAYSMRNENGNSSTYIYNTAGDQHWATINWTPPAGAIQNNVIRLAMDGYYDGDGGDPEVSWNTFERNITIPSLPTLNGFTAANRQACTGIDLSWSINSGNCNSLYYTEIYRNNTLLTTRGPGVESYTDNTTIRDSNYVYKARVKMQPSSVAFTLYGSFCANSVGRLIDSPSSPSGLSATTERCDKKVILTWNWFEANPKSFELYRSSSSSFLTSTLVGTVSGDKRQFDDTSVVRGTSYYYKIKLINVCDVPSQLSSMVVGTSPAEANRATFVTSLVDSVNNRIQISWNDNCSYETKYTVERSVAGGVGVSSFEIEPNNTATLSFIDSTASSCSNYLYSIKVYSTCSSSGLVSTNSAQGKLTPNLSQTFNLTDHKLLVSKGYYSTNVQLEWNNANSAQLTQFKIYRKQYGSNSDSVIVGSVLAGNGTYIDQNTIAGVLYKYTIIGETQCGGSTIYSNYSEDVGFRSPSGVINGQVTYTGGIAVRNARVIAATTTGLRGSSLQLAGSGVLTVPYSSDFNFGSEFTVEGYFKCTNLSAHQVLVSNNVGGVGFYITKPAGGGNINFVVYTSAGIRSITATNAMALDNWCQVSAVFSGTSLKLFINGVQAVVSNFGSVGNYVNSTNNISIGQFFTGNIDEVRIWNYGKTSSQIATDYNRSVNPDETGLVAYYNLDENISGLTRFFDGSKTGNNFNMNDGTITSGVWSTTIPSSAQLGLASYSDSSGNYTISNVRYQGSGQNFTITPSLALSGVAHSFSPGNSVLFIGDGAIVQNNVNFTDNSSFLVTGNIRYINCTCPSSNVSILVDGQPIVSAGQIVSTDAIGNFQVQVPIGQHVVEAKLTNHTFSAGRFPPSGTYEFLSPISGIQFIDSTLVKTVGRVVGGKIETDKVPGLGRSKNNIGKARITFNSEIGGAAPCFTGSATTSKISGEYTAYLPSLRLLVNEIKVLSDSFYYVFGAQPVLDLSNSFTQTKVLDTLWYANHLSYQSIDSTTYQKRYDITWREIPSLFISSSSVASAPSENTFIGESNIDIDSTSISLLASGSNKFGPLPFPVFNQEAIYTARIWAFESYSNKDSNVTIFDKVPVNGSVSITNDLAQTRTVSLAMTSGMVDYQFRGGMPNTLVNLLNPDISYTRNMQITLQPDGAASKNLADNRFTDNLFKGYIFGAKSTGNNFVTKGPEMVDLILRDPPGSGSNSYWSSGKSYSTTSTVSSSNEKSQGFESKLLLGTKLSFSTGAVSIDNEYENNVTAGVSRSAVITNDQEFSETITTTTTISTSTSTDQVGANADIFYGKSRNILFGLSDVITLVDTATCRTLQGSNPNPVCFGTPINGKMIGKKTGFFMVPGDILTTFAYTGDEIEGVIIPNLVTLRNLLFTQSLKKNGQPKYTAVFNDASDPDFAKKFGSNNDDPLWGVFRSSSNCLTEEISDTTGKSYIMHKDTLYDTDSIRYYNNQIRLWKVALSKNEKEKYFSLQGPDTANIASGFRNFSIGQATVTNQIDAEHSNTTTTSTEIHLDVSTSASIGVGIAGFGFNFTGTLGFNWTWAGSVSNGVTSTTSYGYNLTDGDPGDLISVDVVDPKTGSSHIFRLRGGQTQCPYEGPTYAHYYHPSYANDTITASTYYDDDAAFELASGTAQQHVPDITATPATVVNIPADQPAVITLLLGNNSEARADQTYSLMVDASTNPYGAILKVDGLNPNQDFEVPFGTQISKTLTIERGPGYYRFDSIRIVFKSPCDDDIFDEVWISARFLPTCTKPVVSNLSNNWVVNNSFNNILPIKVSGYNYNFAGLSLMDVEYKLANRSQWNILSTYYKDTPTTEVKIPNDQDYFVNLWNLSQLSDGNYEIMVESECTAPGYSNTRLSSTILAGVIDRINPTPFGTPTPASGILSPTEDISIQFNEPVDIATVNQYNIDVRGVLNGSEINNSTSLFFDGNNDFVEVASGINLAKKSFTVELWSKRFGLGSDQVLFWQGADASQAISISFDNTNRLKFAIGSTFVRVNSPMIDISTFHHYAISYEYETRTVLIYVDGVLSNNGNTNLYSVFEGAGKIYFGKSPLVGNRNYIGNLSEIRLWMKARTQTEILSTLSKQLTGTESGIIGNWRMDDAEGISVKDYVRSRNGLITNAIWSFIPGGSSLNFTGTNSYLNVSSSNVALSKEMDFTFEFWFKGSNGNNIGLFSNGKGDTSGLSPYYSWFIGTDATGKIIVTNNGTTFLATDKSFFDGNWHHFALVMQRTASLSSYIDGSLQKSVQPSAFGEFGSSKIWLGARGYNQLGGISAQDKFFTGKMDEFRIWNVSRKQEQIQRDKLNRLSGTEPGLLMYVPCESYQVVLGVPILTNSYQDIADTSHASTAFGVTGFSTETPPIKLQRPVSAINYTYSLNGDKIIITPTTSAALIENVTLDITVKNILDLNGNIMQSPKTWIAYMNKNQVKWQNKEVTLNKKSGESQSFTGTIINSGGALKQWTIHNLPAWLSASATSGAISPNSTSTITFTVDPNTNIGEYEQNIQLLTDFGYAEILFVSLKVTADPPSAWTINPANYQYTMNIIGQLKINDALMTSTDDKIAAFVGNECRGVGNLSYYPQYDKYLVFLTVYTNNTNVGLAADQLTFKIWNSGAGKIHSEVTPTISFIGDALIGSVLSPQTFVATDKLTRSIPLSSGWNWLSFNLLMKDSSNINLLFNGMRNSQGDIFRAQASFSDYAVGSGWQGKLGTLGNGIKPQFSYRIKKLLPDTLIISGSEIDPSTRPVPIDSGWNWIGFMSQRNLSVNEAFGNYTALSGDLVKSQSQFSVYDPVLGWVGSLTTLVPNKGYMMKSGKFSTLIYPASAMFGKNTVAETSYSSKYWKLTSQNFDKNMEVIVDANACEEAEANQRLSLGAFVGNELRGATKVSTLKNQKGLYFLSISSNNVGEEVEFKLLDEVTGTTYNLSGALSFNGNMLQGSIQKPVQLYLINKIDCSKLASNTQGNKFEISAYPNPFNETIRLNIYSAKNEQVSFKVYDIMGKLVDDFKAENLQYVDWHPSSNGIRLPSGLYFIEATYGNEKSRIKVIKY